MKIISARLHGFLDYVVVVMFLAAPSVLGLTDLPMMISYGLAVVHFTMTILTDFSMGLAGLIPLNIHGKIEHIVGIAMPIMPFVLGFEGVTFYFFFLSGLAIFLVGIISHYEETAPEVTQP